MANKIRQGTNKSILIDVNSIEAWNNDNHEQCYIKSIIYNKKRLKKGRDYLFIDNKLTFIGQTDKLIKNYAKANEIMTIAFGIVGDDLHKHRELSKHIKETTKLFIKIKENKQLLNTRKLEA